MEETDVRSRLSPTVPTSPFAIAVCRRVAAKCVVILTILSLALITFWPGPATWSECCASCQQEYFYWALWNEHQLTPMRDRDKTWEILHQSYARACAQSARETPDCQRDCLRYRTVEWVIASLLGR